MEITIWESSLIKRIRKINNSEIKYTGEQLIGICKLFNDVDQDVLALSHETIEEKEQEEVMQEQPMQEQISQPIVYEINWDLFKENKYEVYLLPKTNRSEEIRLRTKGSLTALRKGYIIKIIDIPNKIPLIIEIDNVKERFDNAINTEVIGIEGIHLNKLPSEE